MPNLRFIDKLKLFTGKTQARLCIETRTHEVEELAKELDEEERKKLLLGMETFSHLWGIGEKPLKEYEETLVKHGFKLVKHRFDEYRTYRRHLDE
jgi:hypothetical protein